MKRTMLVAALVGLGTLAGCDDYEGSSEPMPPPVDAEVMAPSVEENTAPVVEMEAPSEQEAYVPPLPEDTRPSEETVQPESETLFY